MLPDQSARPVALDQVKHGYAAAPAHWPYSTFLACVARGLYPEADRPLANGTALDRRAGARRLAAREPRAQVTGAFGLDASPPFRISGSADSNGERSRFVPSGRARSRRLANFPMNSDRRSARICSRTMAPFGDRKALMPNMQS